MYANARYHFTVLNILMSELPSGSWCSCIFQCVTATRPVLKAEVCVILSPVSVSVKTMWRGNDAIAANMASLTCDPMTPMAARVGN